LFLINKVLLETEKNTLSSKLDTLNEVISEKNLELQTEKSFFEEKQRVLDSKLKEFEAKNILVDEENKKISQENVCKILLLAKNFFFNLFLIFEI
jgi:hypothetical protein